MTGVQTCALPISFLIMKIALIGYGKMGKEIEKVAVARPPHYYPSITPPAKAFGGKDVVQDLLTPVFTNC